ncbi:MAG: S-layer homology domain-containing protein [Oscillospiraceae bacterium]|nr:S-layer homology domain-containing protein [Oscillospiraceae bacterium]
MKRLFALTLAVMMLCSLVCTASANPIENPFTDVSEGAWYYEDVLAAVEMGLINGKTTTTYAPNDFITHAEVLKLAACMNQRHTTGEITLKNGTPWYQPYVDYCASNNIGSAEPEVMNDYATRAWFMTVFASALPESEYEVINGIEDGTIPDVPEDSEFWDVAYKLYRAGIVTGVDENHTCKPNTNIKRSEVATILIRMMNKEKRVKFTMIHEQIDPNLPNVEINGHPSIVVPPSTVETPVVQGSPTLPGITTTPLVIQAQPESLEASEYSDVSLKILVEGGIKPYTYRWSYRSRRDTVVIENSDAVSGATTDTLTISLTPDGVLVGQPISCTVTDAAGNTVTSDTASVFGPFSMTVAQSLWDNGQQTLTGRLSDGWLKVGEKVSVERNGKIIAFGTVESIEMFEKALEEAKKGDNVGIVFAMTDGVRPQSGDTVIRYRDHHVIDTSDIVN